MLVVMAALRYPTAARKVSEIAIGNWEPMQYNKYQDQFSELDARRTVIYQKLSKLEITQEWYKKFDSNSASTTIGKSKRSAAKFTNEIGVVETKISQQLSEVSNSKERVSRGWNPKYWFASEQTISKVELRRKTAELDQLQVRLGWLRAQVQTHRDSAVREEEELKQYNKHDPLAFEAEIRALNVELGVLTNSLKEVSRKRDDLAVQLQVPLTELERFTSKRNDVAAEFRRAQSMDTEMTRAPDGYERSLIHHRCKQQFGEWRPRAAMVSKKHELEAIDRSIKKLQSRLEVISERASRTIRRLVIDGNNMCYLQNPKKFLGLSALRPVADSLSKEYKVLVIFDAEIREQLRKNDRQIAACFTSTVEVHIVANGEKADESLLKIACKPEDWVISRDMYVDYPEMSAVHGKRLIRYEIAAGRVLVNDLGVDIGY
jgi:hypothetical protein